MCHTRQNGSRNTLLAERGGGTAYKRRNAIHGRVCILLRKDEEVNNRKNNRAVIRTTMEEITRMCDLFLCRHHQSQGSLQGYSLVL